MELSVGFFFFLSIGYGNTFVLLRNDSSLEPISFAGLLDFMAVQYATDEIVSLRGVHREFADEFWIAFVSGKIDKVYLKRKLRIFRPFGVFLSKNLT